MQTLIYLFSKLTELPKAICLLVNLKKLRLDHNKLIKLPSGFSALFVLEKLTLDHNLLIKLPANMGNMKKLKVGHRLNTEIQHRFYFSVGLY